MKVDRNKDVFCDIDVSSESLEDFFFMFGYTMYLIYPSLLDERKPNMS